jgi:hypothetical protein
MSFSKTREMNNQTAGMPTSMNTTNTQVPGQNDPNAQQQFVIPQQFALQMQQQATEHASGDERGPR